MKRNLFLICFMLITVNLVAQVNIMRPIPSNLFPKDLSGSKVLKNEFKFIPRFNVGVMGTSYGKNPDTKVMEVTPLSAIGFGIGLLRYKDVEGVPFNDIGINMMYLQNTQTPGSGVGIYGTYNTGPIGLLNIGTHYEFQLKQFFIDTGLTFHF
jgi:hypothetical protein